MQRARRTIPPAHPPENPPVKFHEIDDGTSPGMENDVDYEAEPHLLESAPWRSCFPAQRAEIKFQFRGEIEILPRTIIIASVNSGGRDGVLRRWRIGVRVSNKRQGRRRLPPRTGRGGLDR
ncbi:hypothetical protein KM043_015274 [Ampulex compressa]|nr:hypothetical protein KM043_015274 [Ampulex compressa]